MGLSMSVVMASISSSDKIQVIIVIGFRYTNMRCSCCNRALNDYESTLKSAQTGDYLDTCMKCLDGLEIETLGREDLSAYADVDSEEDIDFDEWDE